MGNVDLEGAPAVSFATRVDVVYGVSPTGENADLLIILVPYVGNRNFYRGDEKSYPLYRLLRESEVRRGKDRVVLITHLWVWERYLRMEAERVQKEAGIQE
jgi:hypothetical protein